MARFRLSRGLLAALLSVAGLAPLAAQPSSCVPQLIGADRRGPAQAISRSGNTLYLAAGAAVVVVDTTDLLNPVERGYVNLDELVLDVAHWQTTAIALGEHGLAFIDAADPAQPEVVGTFAFPTGWFVETVTARDDLTYIPESNGLHVLDFSDPSAPMEIGDFPASDVRDVVLNGNRAYLLAGTSLLVLDISNPVSPTQLASVAVSSYNNDRLSIAGNGNRLAVHGNWDWGHHYGSAVEFFGLADPSLPVLRSSLWFDDWTIEDVEFAENRAYVSELVYYLGDLSNPVYLGSMWPLLWGRDMARSPDLEHLFVADPRAGLQVADLSDPANAQIAASVEMPEEAIDGYVAGSIAVLVREHSLETIDLTDPRRPALLGSLPWPSTTLGEIRRVGDFAYVASGYGDYNFRIFDLTDPTQPVATGSIGTYVWNVPALNGDALAIVDDCASFVRLFDVSDPGSPLEVGAVSLDDSCYKTDLALGPGRLYVWDYNASPMPPLLRIFDTSDPSSPIEIGSTPIALWHWGRSAVRGRHLLLTDEDRFDVYDVGEPTSPLRVASLPLPLANWYQRKVTIYGSQAIVAPNRRFREYYDERFFVVDLSNPLSPEVTAAIETPGDAHGAFAGPGVVVVADGPAGISIYSSCVPFADGFEGGDTSEWSNTRP